MKPTIEDFIRLLTENIEGLEECNLNPNTNYKDTDGWNSMNALLIMALLETEFDISITVEQMKQCQTVEDLYKLTS
jgi:acyl carrier protein